MTERKITVQVIQYLNANLRHPVTILKHSDRATSAIPDLSVSWRSFTYWIEMKLQRRDEGLKDIVRKDQLILGHQLAEALDGRCWHIVFQENPRQMTIWRPQALFAYIWPNVAGVDPEALKAKFMVTDQMSHLINIKDTLRMFGAIRVPDWNSKVVADLIQGYHDPA